MLLYIYKQIQFLFIYFKYYNHKNCGHFSLFLFSFLDFHVVWGIA